MIDQYAVYQKIKELNALLEQVETQRRMPLSIAGNSWMQEIGEQMEEIQKKRHLLNAAGKPCPCCGGSGRA